MPTRPIVLATLWVCACGVAESPPECAAVRPPVVTVSAAEGDLALGFDVDISAPGIEVQGGKGTLDGLPLVVYERQPWPQIGLVLYQGLAASAEAWQVVWFYCSNGRLSALYRESTAGGGAQPVEISGSCVEHPGGRTAHVRMPEAHLAMSALVSGYSISGPDIELGCAAPGRVTLDGRELSLLVFGAIDCRDCGSPGWRELHSILWDAERGRACFGILYLIAPGQVVLEYSLSLPDLKDPGPIGFSAEWSAPE